MNLLDSSKQDIENNNNTAYEHSCELDKVVKIINDIVKPSIIIASDTMLESLNMDSIQYMKLVVELEAEFNMEFDISCLTKEYFQTVSELLKYVKGKR